MKKLAGLAVVALAGGIGFGVGHRLLPGGPWGGSPLAWAQGVGDIAAAAAAARSGEEQTVIRVARRVRPAVVSVNRRGGTGSGVIIRGDGIILTNEHVVRGAREVQVQMAGGRMLTGRVLGTDPIVDIAVI